MQYCQHNHLQLFHRVWLGCVCVLTRLDGEGDSGTRENSPGCCILGVADVVVSAVGLQKIRKVQLPIQADHHSFVLLDVHHPWGKQDTELGHDGGRGGEETVKAVAIWKQEGSLVLCSIDFHMWVKRNGQLKRHYFIRQAVREWREDKKKKKW